jgi:hypothetical protein
VDLPDVNAREKTKKGLMEALRIDAPKMLATEIFFEPNLLRTAI